jgi:putative flippase GtrA
VGTGRLRAAAPARPPVGAAWVAALLGVLGQYLRFAAVGLLNAAVDLAVLNLLLLLWPTSDPLGLTVENSLAVALAIANSYVWNTRWTFRREADGSLRQLGLFVAQSLLNIAINDAALVLTAGQVRRLHLGPAWVGVNLSKGAAMAFASSTSFLIMRLVVFRPTRRGRGAV